MSKCKQPRERESIEAFDLETHTIEDECCYKFNITSFDGKLTTEGTILDVSKPWDKVGTDWSFHQGEQIGKSFLFSAK